MHGVRTVDHALAEANRGADAAGSKGCGRSGQSMKPAAALGERAVNSTDSSSALSLGGSARYAIVTLGLFSALSAAGGGAALIAFHTGSRNLPPLATLAHTPFATFLVPGVILTVFVGGTSLLCAVLAWRRARLAIDATLLAGGALTFWIVAEVAMMRGLHWLQLTYGGLGLALLGLGVRAAVCSHEPRHRWVVLVTLAEAVGFAAPITTGMLAYNAGFGEINQAALVISAGLLEGLALGAGQAWAFPLPLRKGRFSLLTSIAAGLAWASAMLVVGLATSDGASRFVAVLLGTVAAVVGLLGLGGAQWLELRRRTPRAHRWIFWTALAWVAALPLSFLPGPFVDEETPLWASLTLFAVGGVQMAYVMALITWQGVRRLTAQA